MRLETPVEVLSTNFSVEFYSADIIAPEMSNDPEIPPYFLGLQGSSDGAHRLAKRTAK